MKSQATHQNFKNWKLATIQLDQSVRMTEKAVQLIGEIVKGSVLFPFSCVNVIDQFEVEVPVWLLKKNGLNYLT